jgi:outer membrane protein TolC
MGIRFYCDSQLMKIFIRLLPFCGGLLLTSVVVHSAIVMPEDLFPELKQVLAQATAQSPRMVASNLALLQADGDLQQARSGLYPSVGGFYSVQQARDKREDLPGRTLEADRTYYSFSINQPLFHWGERRNNARIGEIRRQIADENYGAAYDLLTQEVRTAYLVLALRKQQARHAAFSLTMAENALKVAEQRMAKGEIAEGAIFPVRVGAEQARLALETTEWDLALAKQNFSVLTGLPEPTDASLPDGIPSLTQSYVEVQRELARFLAQDEPNTPSLRNQRRNVQIADLSYQNQKTRLRPKLNFVAAITQDEQSYTLNIAQKYGLQSQYVGLQVNWQIFDGFATRGAIASTLAAKHQAEHAYKQLTETIARDAQRAAKNVELAQRQMAISDWLLSNSKGYLEYRQEDFRRGQASETDVGAAQAAYNSALASANSARYTYLIRVAEFVNHISEGTVPPKR